MEVENMSWLLVIFSLALHQEKTKPSMKTYLIGSEYLPFNLKLTHSQHFDIRLCVKEDMVCSNNGVCCSMLCT